MLRPDGRIFVTGNHTNAAMESFWSSLKRELVHRIRFATRTEARAAILELDRNPLRPGAVPQRTRLCITCGL